MNRRARSDILHVVALAALYYVAGSLSQRLTVQGALGAPVWPGAGIALAFLLARGYRMGIGVLLGAFPTNLHLALAAGGGPLGVDGVVLAANAATGATLQALAAAWLVRRFIGFPRALEDERAALRFIVIAGPLACCVSPSVGATGLWLSGALTLPQYGLTWWTWWVGDSIGALVFTPLTLSWLPSGRQADRRGRLAITVPLVLLFGATVARFLRANAWEEERARVAFETEAHEAADRVSQNVVAYMGLAEAAAGLIEAAPDTDRAAFAHFARRLWRPGVQALEWVPIVPLSERATYEERARRDGLEEFTFTEVGDGIRRPAGPREEYVPVYYVEPLEGNRPAVGVDLLSSPSRRAALETAARTRGPVVTEPVTLVQETGEQRGFLVAAPAFDVARGDAADGALLGYAIGVFRIGDIVSFSLRNTRFTDFALTIEDTTEAGPPAPLHAPVEVDSAAAAGADAGVAAHEHTLDVGGRRWRMTITPSAQFWAGRSRWQAWGVLATGFLFTGPVGVLLAVMTGRAGRGAAC